MARPDNRVVLIMAAVVLAVVLAAAIVLRMVGVNGPLKSLLGTPAWDEAFERVEITSPIDGALQPAYLYKANAGERRPLIVSLHEWSASYSSADPLASLVKGEGWNYIRPDFRGPNNNPAACLSDLAMADIEAAIRFAVANAPVDPGRIFLVGVSGGGYAALGAYLRLRTPVRGVLAWAAISDLVDWYFQSRMKATKYADDIISCTSSARHFCRSCAEARSPLHMAAAPLPTTSLDLYAGLDDGHTGSVPISHSMAFFNKLANLRGDRNAVVTAQEMTKLLTRAVPSSGHDEKIDGRAVYLRRRSGAVSLTIFDGGHELLEQHTMARLRALAAK